MTSTEQILTLVQVALDGIDAVPLDVTVRRTARLASLLGDDVLAVRLGLELKPSGGHPPSNGESTRRMLSDPSTWGDPEGAAEAAVTWYMGDRARPDGLINAHSIAELLALGAYADGPREDVTASILEYRMTSTALLEGVRHHAFTALCRWERQLSFLNTNERIFERFRASVDALLADGAPHLLDSFNAVYRRLREAAATDGQRAATENLSQAVTTCRRILKAVADHAQPATDGVSDRDVPLDDLHYKARLREFTKDRVKSGRLRGATTAAVEGVYDRFAALDGLASKGVHADLALAEAELCAIGTYVLAGEILRLAQVSA